jgi:hypothetical protein
MLRKEKKKIAFGLSVPVNTVPQHTENPFVESSNYLNVRGNKVVLSCLFP